MKDMSLIEIEEKKRIFLDRLEEKKKSKSYKRVINFGKFSGRGYKRKIQRLIFSPNLYINHILNRIGFLKSKKAKLFWDKEVFLNFADTDGFYLGSAGFLASEAEYKLTKFFIKNFKDTDIFYDIGSNYGFYTYLAIEFCKEVHAFEPAPSVFEYLDKSLKNSQNIFLNNIAISNKEGEVDFLFSKEAPGGSKIQEENSLVQSAHIRKIVVPTISLDKYIEDHNKPSMLKVDIEGAESLFIEGAKDFLLNNNSIIAMEVLPKDNGRDSSMIAVQKLKDLGYSSYFINDNIELLKVDDIYDFLSKNNIESFENFIFKK